MLVSTSWPMPVNTGLVHAAMARAMDSSSKVARSTRDPPPRMTTTTSISACAENIAIAPATAGAAASPCTRTSHKVTRKPMPDSSKVFMKSACAAEPLLATNPIASGITGNVVRRLRSYRPSFFSRAIISSRLAARSPSVKRGSMSIILKPNEPDGAYTSGVPRIRTLIPLTMSISCCFILGSSRCRAPLNNFTAITFFSPSTSSTRSK